MDTFKIHVNVLSVVVLVQPRLVKQLARRKITMNKQTDRHLRLASWLAS